MSAKANFCENSFFECGSMRYVVANLKMKLVSKEENSGYLAALTDALKGWKGEGINIVVCPSFPFLGEFGRRLPKRVALGAQDVASDDTGAFTGDVSPKSLTDLGATYALVGHSERREYHHETDEFLAKKLTACLRNTLQPILCVGETAVERSTGKTFSVIRRQIELACAGISSEEFKRVIIAYEPRWAIGADRTPSSNEILEVIIAIRRTVVEMFDRESADTTPILYGGSVSADRVSEVLRTSGLAGVLIGREGLVPKEIVKIADMFVASVSKI